MRVNNTYSFDGFALIKVTDPDETYFKVFGSTSGGYLDGDYWRMNSYVVSVHKDENYYYFRGGSGSCYKVPIGGGHISSHNSLVLHQALHDYPEMELVDIDSIEIVLEEYGIEITEVV